MQKYRLWMILTVFFLSIGISRNEAEGAENTAEIRKVQTESEDLDGDGSVDKITDFQYYINPEFADTVSDDELRDMFQDETALAKNTNITYHTSIQTAVVDLRKQLVARNEVIYVGIRREDYHSSLPNEMLMMALEHTGVEKEGDYIDKQYSSCPISAEWVKDGDIWNAKLIYQPQYYSSAAQEAAVDQKLALVMMFLDLDGKDEYTKIKTIYDYICQNVSYDYANKNNDTYKLKYTAYAALINRTAVCQGYSVLFYRMALAAGLDCRYISGTTNDGERHGWNIVKIGERYYNLDPTWDAGKSSQKWFLKCMGTFVNHNRNLVYTEKNFQLRYLMALRDYQVGVNYQETIANSGKCGVNLIWNVDENLCLSISGTGAMYDYSDSSPAPWSRYKLTKVIIGEGVTSVGAKAFAYQSTLNEVFLPGTVTAIEKEAFTNCRLLNSILFPQSLEEIGEQAFYRCGLIGVLNIPENVKRIKTYAFAENAKITTLVLSKGLTSVEDFAFFGCIALENLTYPTGLHNAAPNIFSGCNVIKNVTLVGSGEMKNYTTDVPAPFNRSTVQYVTIQEGITSVGEYTFQNARNLKTIVLPSSLKKIGGRAFKWCSNLESVVLPNGLTDIGIFAFYECTGLKAVTMPITMVNADNSIFSYCKNVEQLTITGNGAMKDYMTASEVPWYYLNALKKVTVTEGVTHIGRNVFNNKEELTTVEISPTVRSIGGYAFANCDMFNGITEWDQITTIGEHAFWNCPQLIIKAKEGTVIAEYASKNKLNYKSTGLMTPIWKKIENTEKGIKLSWSKVSGASGYRIYRSNNGVWKKLTDIKKGSQVSYVDTSVKNGVFYAYRICALKKGKISSDYSLTNANSVYLAVPKLTEVKNISGKKLQVKWKKVKGVGGYELRYVTGKNTKTIQIKKNKVKQVISGLKKKKTYKISIRTYKKVNNVVWYSAWSKVKKGKVTR